MTEFMNVGQWPSDVFEQQLLINQLKLALKSHTDSLYALANYVIVIEQATMPLQADWETEWAAQTGRALPILPSATLLWIDTNIDAVGGIFGTTPLSTTVIRRESRYPIGGVAINEVDYLSAAVTSVNTAININNSNHPNVEFDLPVTADLILSYELYVQLISGTGTWGADFLINGVKAGTQYQGIPTVTGIVNNAASGLLKATIFIPSVPAGHYLIQAIMGVTGAPASAPVISYGGIGAGANQYGVRTLRARAIAV